MTDQRMRRLRLVLLGATAFALTHAAFIATWQVAFHGGDGLAPWFMNSTLTVVCTMLVFSVVGLSVSALDPNPSVDSRFLSTTYIVGGAAAPMVAVLFTMHGGPGNLFPITIVIGLMILFVGTLTGAWLAWAFRTFERRR